MFLSAKREMHMSKLGETIEILEVSENVSMKHEGEKWPSDMSAKRDA